MGEILHSRENFTALSNTPGIEVIVLLAVTTSVNNVLVTDCK
jgi:hypothetical protein